MIFDLLKNLSVFDYLLNSSSISLSVYLSFFLRQSSLSLLSSLFLPPSLYPPYFFFILVFQLSSILSVFTIHLPVSVCLSLLSLPLPLNLLSSPLSHPLSNSPLLSHLRLPLLLSPIFMQLKYTKRNFFLQIFNFYSISATAQSQTCLLLLSLLFLAQNTCI